MPAPVVRHALSALALALSACAARAPQPAAPAGPPATVPAPIAARPAPAITRIDAGESPGSNSHRWGVRSFEIRTTAAGSELRIHDAWSFQGSGMQPHQMPQVNHQCSPWEPVPAAVVAAVPPGARSCVEPVGACASLTRWLAETTPAAPATGAPPRSGPTDDVPLLEPATTSDYGRGFGACGA